MKTAVSLPDHLFRRADEVAGELQIPRSRLFAMALQQFLNNYRQQDVTERLNAVYRDLPARQPHGIMDTGLESLRNLTRDDSW
ncbi:MAG: ChpI protein [Spirochaetaceae bacterium]|nr:ChpI protein [Spirochaetaceae bacterium]